MQQKLAQNFFTTRSWSFWKKHRKGTAKATPKIEKDVCYIFTENFSLPAKQLKWYFFCKHVLTLLKNDPNVLTLKVA